MSGFKNIHSINAIVMVAPNEYIINRTSLRKNGTYSLFDGKSKDWPQNRISIKTSSVSKKSGFWGYETSISGKKERVRVCSPR